MNHFCISLRVHVNFAFSAYQRLKGIDLTHEGGIYWYSLQLGVVEIAVSFQKPLVRYQSDCATNATLFPIDKYKRGAEKGETIPQSDILSQRYQRGKFSIR